MSQDDDVKVKIMVDVDADSFVMLDRWDETFLTCIWKYATKWPKYIANFDLHKRNVTEHKTT